MLVFLRSPLGRWVALGVLLPLLAALLGWVARSVQRRSGHPTRTSRGLFKLSRIANRHKGGPAESEVARPATVS
jgi:hypothetical protein